MERTRHVVMQSGRNWLSCRQWRHMTTKPPTRAAVHGVQLPAPDILDIEKEEVEKEIQKAKEKKVAKREHIEKIVESYLKNYPKAC